MDTQTTNNPGDLSFSLPAAITIESVEPLAASLQELSLSQNLTLNAASTEVITTSGAQLLLVLGKTLEARGLSLRIENAKPIVGQVFQQLGLAQQYATWEKIRD